MASRGNERATRPLTTAVRLTVGTYPGRRSARAIERRRSDRPLSAVQRNATAPVCVTGFVLRRAHFLAPGVVAVEVDLLHDAGGSEPAGHGHRASGLHGRGPRSDGDARCDGYGDEWRSELPGGGAGPNPGAGLRAKARGERSVLRRGGRRELLLRLASDRALEITTGELG